MVSRRLDAESSIGVSAALIGGFSLTLLGEADNMGPVSQWIFVVASALCGALERGIGSAGLSKGDALTYLWAAPDLVRVLVRGEAAGEVRDPRLGRQLHGGFLGGEPSSPEAKDEVPKGAVALFRAAA